MFKEDKDRPFFSYQRNHDLELSDEDKLELLDIFATVYEDFARLYKEKVEKYIAENE